MTIGTRSRAGSLDTTRTELEQEQEQEQGSLLFEKDRRESGTYQSSHRRGGSLVYDHHHDDLLGHSGERQKTVELAAETIWVGIAATVKNDPVMTPGETAASAVVEME